jgi:hypothetical protein
MADAKAKTISVTALKYHTHQGKEHQEGSTYDVDEAQVENLIAQGMAKPTDQVKQEQAAAKEAAKSSTKAMTK